MPVKWPLESIVEPAGADIFPMNKQWVTFHLGEARDQITEILTNLTDDRDYSPADFLVQMAHTYHHLNTAWNTQNLSDDIVANHSMPQYYEWEKFPKESELMLGENKDDT